MSFLKCLSHYDKQQRVSNFKLLNRNIEHIALSFLLRLPTALLQYTTKSSHRQMLRLANLKLLNRTVEHIDMSFLKCVLHYDKRPRLANLNLLNRNFEHIALSPSQRLKFGLNTTKSKVMKNSVFNRSPCLFICLLVCPLSNQDFESYEIHILVLWAAFIIHFVWLYIFFRVVCSAHFLSIIRDV